MNIMKDNIITIYDDIGKKDYKVLLVIEKEYYYVIYTDISNENIKKDLRAIKLKSLDSKEPLPISNDEWKMIEKEYQNLIK